MAAVTTQVEPVAGCESTTLGTMRYRPMAAPGFAQRWFPDAARADAFHRAPVVTFDAADQLQQRFLQQRTGADAQPPFHLVPASADYLRAIELGFGWGLVPEPQLAARPSPDGLVAIAREHLDVELHWQRWSLRTASLTRLTDAVLGAARTRLRQD